MPSHTRLRSNPLDAGRMGPGSWRPRAWPSRKIEPRRRPDRLRDPRRRGVIRRRGDQEGGDRPPADRGRHPCPDRHRDDGVPRRCQDRGRRTPPGTGVGRQGDLHPDRQERDQDSGPASKQFTGLVSEPQRVAIREAFIEEFKKRDFDAGLGRAVEVIGDILGKAKAEGKFGGLAEGPGRAKERPPRRRWSSAIRSA